MSAASWPRPCAGVFPRPARSSRRIWPRAKRPCTDDRLAPKRRWRWCRRSELGRVIAGRRKGRVIEEVLLIAVLCQGHALLEGVPGIAKTLIVKSLGRLLGLGFQRVQATPDLMPADILGTTICARF
jgi:MoxR-like ATPase